MARLLGEARVSVLPDGTRFKAEAEAIVRKADLNAKVALQAQSDRFKTEAEIAAREVSKAVSATVKINGDARPLDADLAAIAARTEALKKSLGNLKISDPNMQSFMKGIIRQAEELHSSLDKVGDSGGLTKAAGQLDRMVAASDRVRAALGKTTFAEEEIGAAAKKASVEVGRSVDKEMAAYLKAEAAKADAARKADDRIAKARQADFFDQAKKITETRDMYAKLFSDLDKRDKIKIGVDGQYTDAQMAKIRTKIEALSKKANIRLGLDGKEAETKAVALREKLKLLLKDITVKVRATAGSGFNGVVNYIKGKFTQDAEGAAGGAGNKSGKGFFSGFSSIFTKSHAIAAGVVAALAALPALVGAVGVLGGIALGGALMFTAEKLIKSQVKTLTAQVRTLTSAIGKPASPTTIASQQLAVTNTQDTIKRLESSKKLTASQQQQLGIAKQRLVIEQQTLAASQAKGQGTAGQQAQLKAAQQQLAVLQQEKAAFAQLDNAVSNLKHSFITFAIVASKPLIKPFTDAINYLSGQLNGSLKTAFTKLFTAVGPLIKPVLVSLLEIVQGILPGLTEMLIRARKPLSDMFTGFGKIVGVKIGDWFKAAAPYIQNSSRYFLALVSALGDVITWIIKFGGESAKAFGDPNLRGFGSMIRQIGNDILKLVVPAFTGWIGVMAPVVKAIAQIVTPILNFLVSSPGLVKAIAAIAAVWFLWGKAILIAVLAMKLATPVIIAFDAELDANVIGLVVLGIEALAVAVFLVIKNWKPISGFFVNIWKHIWSGFIGPMINFFTKTIPHAFSVTIDWLKRNWPLLLGIIGGPIAAAVLLVIKYHKQISNAIETAWNHIKNVILGVLKPIASVVEGVWNQIYRVIRDVLKVIATVIKIQTLIEVGLIGEAWRGIKNLTGLVWPWIYKTIKDAWGHIENATTGVVKPMVSLVVGAWNLLKNSTEVDYNWLFHTIKTIWGNIENATTGIVKPMVSLVVGAWNLLKTATGNAFKLINTYIVNPLSGAWKWVKNTFVSGIEGAFRGLVSTVSAIWNTMKRIVAAPINFVITSVWNPFAGFVNRGLSVFGIHDSLPLGKPVKFAKGGHVPGYAPGKDTVRAMLSPGEFVVRPEAVKAIGVDKLHALNKAGAYPKFAAGGAVQQFANGGKPNTASDVNLLIDAERYKGHRYVFGGPSNPVSGWDCSSFVGYVLGHDFGLPLAGGARWNANVHGPVASSYNSTPGFRLVSHNTADILPGDLLVENSGGHVGFGAGPNAMFSAFNTALGTLLTNASNMTNIYRYAGGALPGVLDLKNLAGTGVLGGLKHLAAAALGGLEHLATGALNHVPGKGPFHDLPVTIVKKVMDAAINALNGNASNYQITSGVGGIPSGDTGFSPSAGVTQWEPDVSKVLSMLGLPQSDLRTVMSQIQTESGGNPNAINLCVPLDTVILTRRGWLKHSDVQVGDETIGYNPVTGRSEWTPVTAVHHYDDAPLIRMGNSRWHATTTPQHKWINLPRITVPADTLPDDCPLCEWPEGTRRRGSTTAGGLRIHLARVHGIKGAGQASAYATDARWVTTNDVRSRDRLLLAAPADTGDGLPVTVQEAAILGWIAGDGHVERYSDKPRGRKKPSMSIAQSKPKMVEKLTTLLEGVPCAHYTEAPRLSRVNKKLMEPRHQWRLTPEYAQDLMQRAGHPKQDAVRQVLVMSAEQRDAWLEAITDAEGHQEMQPGFTKPQVSIAQCLGPVHDAIVLAAYLSGHRPRALSHLRDHECWNDSDSISLNSPIITGAFLRKEDAGRGPVWCVTTELGSWTAEEDGHVFLTGNSDSNAQRGDPSKGLMQVISGTFATYRNKALSSNIYDPLANIYAGVNYAIHRYGNPGWLNVLGHGHGYAMGGMVPEGVFDSGGTLAPGANMIYNLTGKPEHLVPDNGHGRGTHITLELGPNFKRHTGLTDQELADIRYTVRTLGGGSAQTAFGKNR